jgi:hypothetical protein
LLVADTSPAAPAEPPRRRRATGLVLQAGAIAGAIASIVGIVLLVVHGVGSLTGGHTGGVNAVETLHLKLPRPSVVHETYGQWATRHIGRENPRGARAIARSAQGRTRGIEVDYGIDAPKVVEGTLYRVTFELFREPGSHPVGTPIDDLKRFTLRGDRCGCFSPFIRVPMRKQSYRVDVTIAPANSHDDSPAARGTTETFRGNA